MTTTYTAAITDAVEDIIRKIYNINLHDAEETWECYEHAAEIRDNTGRTRLFGVELVEMAKTVTTFSDHEDTETLANVVIGYDLGPYYDIAMAADYLAIKHALNSPTSVPDGIAYYLVTEVPIFERVENFRWLNIPVVIRANTTTE